MEVLLGNHELFALQNLKRMVDAEMNNDGNVEDIELEVWKANGGAQTISVFRWLSINDKLDLIDALEKCQKYKLITRENKTFLLVHAGLSNYSPSKKLTDYSVEEIVFCRPKLSTKYFDDTYSVIVGHTPTISINGKPKIYHGSGNVIFIDCGAVYGGNLACLRLNDMAEFYV